MEFPKRLVCPKRTDLELEPARRELTAELSAKAGMLRHENGNAVSAPITDGLVRSDGRMFYRVENRVPVLLVGEGIPLEGAGDRA